MPAGRGQRGKRQLAVLDPGCHGAELKTPTRGDRLLERDALGSRPLDEDMDQARTHGLTDQPVDLDPRHAEPARNLLLGMVAHVGEPSGTRREADLVGLQPSASLSRPVPNFRSLAEKLFSNASASVPCQGASGLPIRPRLQVQGATIDAPSGRSRRCGPLYLRNGPTGPPASARPRGSATCRARPYFIASSGISPAATSCCCPTSRSFSCRWP